MTTARTVPVTTEMDGDELDAEDAWHLARRFGLRRILVESFVRFRYGDGFTNSRALALQACLAVVPFLLALTGLAADLDEAKPARVVARTIEAVSPGSGRERRPRERRHRREQLGGGRRAGPGPRPGLRAGVDDDGDGADRAGQQPHLRHPPRPQGALQVRPGGGADRHPGAPGGAGFLLLVAGGAFADAMAADYGWSATTVQAWNVARWPAGITLLVVTIAALLDHAPRRHQPALSWLALGSGVAVLLTLLATAGLALYVNLSSSFGSIYGPLAGVFALLLWSLLSSIALFYGTAVCAQLESLRAGQESPVYDDPGRPHGQVVEG